MSDFRDSSSGTGERSYRQKAVFALVDVARMMLAGEIGPIEGSRKISSLRCDVEDEENPVFNPFIGIESESEDVVVGDRTLWAEAFLEDIDRKYVAFEAVLLPYIAAHCEALLAVFEPRLRE